MKRAVWGVGRGMIAVVALANKIVRISWAVLARQEEYRQPMPIAA